MCTVSNKIKFCTCTVNDITALDNYWILYRKVNHKEMFMIGEPIIYANHQRKNYHSNNLILCDRLNELDAFDKEIHFQDNDQLLVVFNNISLNGENTTLHCFVYLHGEWKVTTFDSFELYNRYDEIDSGTSENQFI